MKDIVLYLFLLGGLLCIDRPAWAGHNWEYWSHYEAGKSLNEVLDFKLKPELRFKEDFSTYYYSHVDIGLDWKVNDWFILSPYYRYINEEKKGGWTVEHRPHLNATFKWKTIGLNFSDRNRLEYRIKEDKEFFRYTNKLTVKTAKFTTFEIQPYIAEEPFYDFDINEFNKNRVYGGVDIKIIKDLKVGICYMFESNKKQDKWGNVNILKTELKCSF